MLPLLQQRLAVLALLGIMLICPDSIAQAQKVASSEAVIGTWTAQENYFGSTLHVERDADEGFVAFLTGGARIPASQVSVKSDSLFLLIDQLDAQYRGGLSKDQSTIVGTWTQGSRSARVTFVRSESEVAAVPNRPQHPEPPFPYSVDEVTFRSSDGVTLSGTLTRPKGAGPHPGAVLLSGTGPNTRDYEISGHKPFLVLADHLTRQGIAVLRYDERGVAESEGSIATATAESFARDAAAALRFLRKHLDIEAAKAGFITHSQGSYVALRSQDQLEGAAFLVLLVPPGLPGHDVLVEQHTNLAAAAGRSEDEIDSIRTSQRHFFDVIRSDADSATAASQLRAILEEQGVSGQRLEATIEANTMPWWRDFVRFDPRPALQGVDVPVLVILGSKDVFVSPDQNERPLRSALAQSPGENVTVRVVEGINHWLQPAKTGLPFEISQIETTISPEVFDLTTRWLRTHTSSGE